MCVGRVHKSQVIMIRVNENYLGTDSSSVDLFVHPEPKSRGQGSMDNVGGANSGMQFASIGAAPDFVIAMRPEL